MTFEHIIKNINSLPPLSNVAHIVQTLYTGGLENLNVSRLVRVIESDAMLAINILKLINSPYYELRNPVVSIAQAVALLGAGQINKLVIYYAVNEKIKADPSIYGFTNSQFNDLCQLQSSLMFQWYSKINLREAKFLSNLALMMESGKLILANEVIKSDYCGEFRKGFNECESIECYEKSLIGTTSYYLTAILFQHWNIEPKYINILKSLDFTEEELEKIEFINKDKEKNTKKGKVFSKRKTFKQELKVIRTAINVKDILSNEAISKASEIVKSIGFCQIDFEEVAYKIKESYIG
ncbi:MAG: HDOD domain-containing protein [Sulfurimonas sp.]|nr:HDOD domain-containing protein [Sulfurimonas sp.]